MTASLSRPVDQQPSSPGCRDPRQVPLRTLRVAYTPDSDDVFNYYAWEHGPVKLEGFRAEFSQDHIIALNRAAAPALMDRYRILATGSSIGRRYGPVLVSRVYGCINELRGKRIAVAGIPTTGGALAIMFCPGAEFIEMRYDKIAVRVSHGRHHADRFRCFSIHRSMVCGRHRRSCFPSRTSAGGSAPIARYRRPVRVLMLSIRHTSRNVSRAPVDLASFWPSPMRKPTASSLEGMTSSFDVRTRQMRPVLGLDGG